MIEFLFFFHAGVVISSFPDESINGADLGFTTPDQYGPISVPVAGDMSSTVQVSTNVFDSSVANPSNVQGQNFLLNGQFDPSSGQAHGDGNTALLFDESTGGGGGGEGTEILIPSVPTQILEGVPDTTGESLSNLKKPECKVNKYLFCCQKAAPKLKGGKITTGRAPAVEPKVHPDFIEYAQRRRKCHSWSADDPACHWPENIFCCYCKDNNLVAYFCYNQPYTDLPEFQNIRPIPEPREISNPSPDPNPAEQPSGSKKKRDDIVDNGGSLDSSQTTTPAPNSENPLYAESDPLKSLGRKRKPDTCTDKFLESVGVSPYRHLRRPEPKQPGFKEGSQGLLDLDVPFS